MNVQHNQNAFIRAGSFFKGPQLSIVIPTLNERDNIPELVERLHHSLGDIDWEVIFVDDDSLDGSLTLIREIAAVDRRVRGVRRINRRGLAGACIEGMLSSSAPFVAVMDADMQHDETLLPKMFRQLVKNKMDLIVASRFQDSHLQQNGLSKLRHAGSLFAIELARKLLGVSLTDPMSGFFMIRREIVEAVAPQLSQDGFKVLLDIVTSAQKPLRTQEMAFTFGRRLHGESKLNLSVALDYIGLLLSKLTQGRVSNRFWSFCCVGSLGLVLHLSLLFMLIHMAVAFPVAQTLAMTCAMVSNYTFNNALTYRDRRRHGWNFVLGLLTFVLLCSVGLIAGVGVSAVIFTQDPSWWLAGLAGALVGVVWNYVSNSAIAWRAR
ncbi:glycosyltransferase family 2 protein [Rhizobium sp.]|uniref:glycosyltransferase family 2 protein n=1 Tax=Rhizobium sp. TaxID=391 RepID=UPI000E96C05A|nr:dolichol monophosphate mannose synthase [Rhizobium sp.]